MERQSLPLGFRFHPTDQELILYYLRRKVFSCPLPAPIIPEIDLMKHTPWDLLGESKEDRYFFNLRETKYPNSSRANRATTSGYWKASGKEKAVVAPRCNLVVGMKKVLVFYQGKPPNLKRTDWVMHEFRLVGAGAKASILPRNHVMVPARDWVLCRVLRKKKLDVEDDGGIGFIDLARQRERSLRPGSSPSTSCLTEVSDGSGDEEEASSGGPSP